MAKKMLIDATHPEETRVVVVDGNQVDEFDFETASKRQLAGNIYLAKVTRVEPSLQAAFVDYGGNRHGFLAFAEIHPDYYQIPAEDRKALLEEERAEAEAAEAEEDARDQRAADKARRTPSKAEDTGTADAVSDAALASEAIPGMEVLEDDEDAPEQPETLGGEAPAAEEGRAGDDDTQADSANDTGPDGGSASPAPNEARSQPRKPRARRYKIQEVIRVRQVMLVQVVKEERGNKGAALTTYLSLAGRYCVLMPNTARGGGISRKITNVADRKKLKEIAADLKVPQGAGLIIRTAGAERTKTEIRRDYEYLMRLWEEIRDLTFRSVAPAPIYEEGDLIKRSIRDLYSREIDEVLVEGERGYRTAKDFMKMIMPSHARNVKHHTDPMPLFTRYQVESYLAGMFNPVVQLKSGGYIVIGMTEALVAIDVNSGRATKEGSIEDTAFKTNCEAADEIARQLRLRDLAGLIVIDFIDMDERKNNAAVEKRFKDKLKSDRARIQVGRISSFGLLEMSRQRLHPGMLESTTQPCAHCHGTGLIRSDDSMALAILRAIEEEGTRKRSREVVVKAPVAVANFLINQKRDHVAQIEARTGMSVMIEADLSLISPDWTMERFKTATRNLTPPESQVVSVSAGLMAEIDEAHAENDADDGRAADDGEAASAAESESAASEGQVEAQQDEAGNGDGAPRPTRRRRRRRRRNGSEASSDHAAAASGGEANGSRPAGEVDARAEPATASASSDGVKEEAGKADTAEETAASGDDQAAKAASPGTRSRSRSRGRRNGQSAAPQAAATDGEEAVAATDTPAQPDALTNDAAQPADEGVAAKATGTEAISEAESTATPEGGSVTDKAETGASEAESQMAVAKADGAEEAAPEAAPSESEAARPEPVADKQPEAASAQPEAQAEPAAKPVEKPADEATQRPNGAPAAPASASRTAPERVTQGGDDTAAPVPANSDVPAAASAASGDRPKRRGWWSE